MADLTEYKFDTDKGVKILVLDDQAIRQLEQALTQIGGMPGQSIRERKKERDAILAGDQKVPPMLYNRFHKMMQTRLGASPVRIEVEGGGTAVFTEGTTSRGRGKATRGRAKSLSIGDQIKVKRDRKREDALQGRIYRDFFPVVIGPTMGRAKGDPTSHIFAVGKYRGTVYIIEQIAQPTPLPFARDMPKTKRGRERAQKEALKPYLWQARVLSHPWTRVTRGGFGERQGSGSAPTSGLAQQVQQTRGTRGKFQPAAAYLFRTGELISKDFPVFEGKEGWKEAQAGVEDAIDKFYAYRVAKGDVPPELERYVKDEIKKVRSGGRTPSLAPTRRKKKSGNPKIRSRAKAALSTAAKASKQVVAASKKKGKKKKAAKRRNPVGRGVHKRVQIQEMLPFVLGEIAVGQDPSSPSAVTVLKRTALIRGEEPEYKITRKGIDVLHRTYPDVVEFFNQQWSDGKAAQPVPNPKKVPTQNGLLDDWKERRAEAKDMESAIKAKLKAEARVSRHEAKEAELREKRAEKAKERAGRSAERDRKRAAGEKYRAERIAEHGESYGTVPDTVGVGLAKIAKGGKKARARFAKMFTRSEEKKLSAAVKGQRSVFKNLGDKHINRFEDAFKKWHNSVKKHDPDFSYLLDSYEELLIGHAYLTLGGKDDRTAKGIENIRDALLGYLRCVDPQKAELLNQTVMKGVRGLSTIRGNPKNPTTEVHQEMGEGFLAESEKLWESYCKTRSPQKLLDAYRVLELAYQEFEYTGDKKRMKQAADGIKAARSEIMSGLKKPVRKAAKKKTSKKKAKKRTKKASKKKAK